eukprot:gnl/MRDRNA2_/MRDRNA2_123662_c0_seq1.p1 gnl/MRDRNA2_/MRDRNA2_123662_c0~~gnl/MRDRNA2_/MRDRNA2_123662_c0_seq1.p1  ORF type:complete len:306 (+),score=69.74 gnl/MRDRNA2_/MRDRNA2_123662_c0_seq1:49-918(+)
MDGSRKCRVGIVGYGSLGVFLADKIINDSATASKLEIAFIWNRTPDAVNDDVAKGVLPAGLHLENLGSFADFNADLIVEVAHPSITAEFGAAFLKTADYFVGSPTCFADADVEAAMRAKLKEGSKSLFVPSGALWGIHDIQKMADRGTLKSLQVSMTFAPPALKVNGEVAEKLAAADGKETLLYEGSVRGLCPMAPNNTNTMAAAAMAGHTVGFDGTVAKLIAAPPGCDAHRVIVEVGGPDGFSVNTTRINPAKPGAVTGKATFVSFLSSVLSAARLSSAKLEPNIHFV